MDFFFFYYFATFFIVSTFFIIYSGQLFDGFDEEYQCPILDEDRVCTTVMDLISMF